MTVDRLAVGDESVDIVATVRTTDRTGVEMEALTAVSVAALTVVDMVKAVDKAAVITDVRVETKTGGKSGDWADPAVSLRAEVVVASNRAAAGVYADETGPLIVEFLQELGFTTGAARRPGRGPGRRRHRDAAAGGAGVVLTTGGTGLTPTDQTPEVTRALLDPGVPGIAEAIRPGARASTARIGRRRRVLPGGEPARLAGRGEDGLTVLRRSWCTLSSRSSGATGEGVGATGASGAP